MTMTSKRIAIVGSSGGGNGALDSSNHLIEVIVSGLKGIQNIEVIVSDILFITCNEGMDTAKSNTTNAEASLWTTYSKAGTKSIISEFHCEYKGSLDEVNKKALLIDEIISKHIYDGNIDAVISISSDPDGINTNTVLAAIDVKIPIVGTGGTSMSFISTSGGNVIGCSGGSVATTAVSRSICFAASLAAHWGVKYKLMHAPEWPKLRSVCGASLPILLAVMMTKLVSKSIVHYISNNCNKITSSNSHLSDSNSVSLDIMYKMIAEKVYTSFQPDAKGGLNFLSNYNKYTILELFNQAAIYWINDFIHTLEYSIIPVVVSAFSCLEGSKLGEISLISGAASGALLTHLKMGLIPAYISGSLCGYLLPNLMVFCPTYSFLPSAVSIVSIGVSSLISGVFVLICSSLFQIISILFQSFLIPGMIRNIFPILDLITMGSLVHYLQPLRFLFGSLLGSILGYLVSLGSEEGYYHIILLPIIAIEMQYGDPSIAGAFDVLCLCLPCAGVCLGVWVLTSSTSSSAWNRQVPSDTYNSNSNRSKYNDDDSQS